MQPNSTIQPMFETPLAPRLSLAQRGVAEFSGTLLLTLVLLAAKLYGLQSAPVERVSGSLAGSVAVGATASALLLALGRLALGTGSGGNFNPLIALLEWIFRLHDARCTAVLLVAQFAGGVCGAMLGTFLAGALNPLGANQTPPHGWIFAELFSSAGLMIVYFGCLNSGRKDFTPLAVGAWLAASAIGLPAALANPAVALGVKAALGDRAMLWSALLLAILIQCLGALLAAGLLTFLFPKHGPGEPQSFVTQNAAEKIRASEV
jgi:glycerol uptake facilitator-like aquaporin